MRFGDDLITDPQETSNHDVTYFKNLLCTNPFFQDQLLVEKVIPNLVEIMMSKTASVRFYRYSNKIYCFDKKL